MCCAASGSHSTGHGDRRHRLRLGYRAVDGRPFALLLFACYRRILTGIDWAEVVNLKPLKTFFIVNRGIMLRTFCIVAVYTFFTGHVGMDEPALLAVNTLLLQLFTLFSYMNDGFAYAEALTGRSDRRATKGRCATACAAASRGARPCRCCSSALYRLWREWRELVGLFVTARRPMPRRSWSWRESIVWIILIPVASAMPFIMDGIMVGRPRRASCATRCSGPRRPLRIFYVGYAIIGNNALAGVHALHVPARVLQYFMTHRLRSIYVKATV